jgi:uncharacterized protein (TIGR02001 family)
MKAARLFALASLLFELSKPGSGQVAPAASGAWTVTPAIVSQYMFRGVRLGGPSFEPTVQYDRGNLELGVWGNSPLSDKVPGQSNPEIDPYGWYKIPVNESFSIQPGFTWYTFINAEPKNGFYRMTFEPNVAANWTVNGLTLTPKVYYDVVLKGPTAEVNAAYALPLKTIGTELDFNASVGTYKWKAAVAQQSPPVKGWGDYWLVGVTVPYQIAANAKIAVGFAYTRGSGNYFKQAPLPKAANPAAVGRGVVTLSYALTF